MNFVIFRPNMLRLIATISKCPDFLPEMSGILDTRIPTYCISANFQGTFINYGVMNIANNSTGSNTGDITYAKP